MQNVTKDYYKGTQEIPALRGIDLSISKGEFLSIVGPSGSGKTTLLNILGCIDIPTSGKIIYLGKDLGAMAEKDLTQYRKDHISFIFQSFNLIPVLTVRENVELPLVIERKYSKQEMKRMALESISLVGISELANRLPKELSGGQEQRVAIARSLVKNPFIVLADEPTANLDSKTSETIMSVMKKMNHEQKTTFIFSTHDPLVQKHAKRVINLIDGKVETDERK